LEGSRRQSGLRSAGLLNSRFSEYQLEDRIQYIDYSTRDLQQAVTPAQVLQILKDGNERFRTGRRLTRDLGRQVEATAAGQHPLAVVLSCIDSRTPAELIFDLGVGDIFSVRLAGNVTSRKVLGSIEYACAVAGAKLVVVMGHTRCGAVKAAVDLMCVAKGAAETTGCDHLDHIIEYVQQSVDRACLAAAHVSAAEKETFVNGVARRNVDRVVEELRRQSRALARLVEEGRVAIAGAMYNVATGAIEFLADEGNSPSQPVASS
jgi:carbonic anhydrase/SulP family sulfate permease